MKKKLFALGIVLMISSCTTHKHKIEIERKAEQSSIEGPAGLEQKINDEINNSKHLTSVQKSKVREIIAQNKKRSLELSSQSYKLRGILAEELLSKKINYKKIKIIKKKIQQIEKDKLENTFQAIEKICSLVEEGPGREYMSHTLKQLERNLR